MCRTTIQLRDANRDWIESWKRKLNVRSNGEVITKLRKLVTTLKLHEELESLKNTKGGKTR